MCRRIWFTLLFGIRNIGSSGVTPRSSSFEEESELGFGVSGEEVYVGWGVDQEWMFGLYLSEGSYVGNDKGLFERNLLISHEGGWFWTLSYFLVLCWLTINKLTK